MESIKYFGVTIDQHLKWDVQINNLTIKIYKLNNFYINERNIFDKQTLRMVYFDPINKTI